MNRNEQIDDYANSMFMFEELNSAWITRCANYLKHIFGIAIQGATVIDYAFGRGNWSLAFIQAGAKKVIAIDASISNVARFSKYITENNISGIDVIEGNILLEPIDVQADILWIYGILHHIQDEKLFVGEIIKMWLPHEKGLGLLYSYNDNSLRKVIINLARRGLIYKSYEEFKLDSFFFSHNARLRVRDDLTAPHVSWHSLESMKELLLQAGASVYSCVESFSSYEKTETAEFRPHHLLFSRKSEKTKFNINPELGIDEQIIYDLGTSILSVSSPSIAKKISIGITNTHFNALANGGYRLALIEVFLYLFYAFKVMDLKSSNILMDSILDLSHLSLRSSTKRSISKDLRHSLIADYLLQNNIRI